MAGIILSILPVSECGASPAQSYRVKGMARNHLTDRAKAQTAAIKTLSKIRSSSAGLPGIPVIPRLQPVEF